MTEEQSANYYVAFQRGPDLVLVEVFKDYEKALEGLRKIRTVMDQLSVMFPESWEDVACSFRYCSRVLRIVKVEVVYA